MGDGLDVLSSAGRLPDALAPAPTITLPRTADVAPVPLLEPVAPWGGATARTDLEASATHPSVCDPHAFAALYVRHRPSFRHLAARYLKDARDVDEVLQEAFLRLFLALPELEHELQVLAYCRRTVTNLCIDRLRGDKRHPMLTTLSDEVAEELIDLSEEDPLLVAEDAAIVRQALALLSPLHREALVKREIEEKPLDVIAAELEIPADSVKHVLYRARRALRKLLVGTAVEPGIDLDQARAVSASRNRRAAGAAVRALILVLGVVLGTGNTGSGGKPVLAEPRSAAPVIAGPVPAVPPGFRAPGVLVPTLPAPVVTGTGSQPALPGAGRPSQSLPGAGDPVIAPPTPLTATPLVPDPTTSTPTTSIPGSATPGTTTPGTVAPGSGTVQPAVAPPAPPTPVVPTTPVASAPSVVVEGLPVDGKATIRAESRGQGTVDPGSEVVAPTATGDYPLRQVLSFDSAGALTQVSLTESLPTSTGDVATLVDAVTSDAVTRQDGSLQVVASGTRTGVTPSSDAQVSAGTRVLVDLALDPQRVRILRQRVRLVPGRTSRRHAIPAPPVAPAVPVATAATVMPAVPTAPGAPMAPAVPVAPVAPALPVTLVRPDDTSAASTPTAPECACAAPLPADASSCAAPAPPVLPRPDRP